MHLARRSYSILCLGLLLFPAALFASPMIAIDSADFNVGNVREGEAKSIKHTFVMKNIGDSTLVIEKVKPG